MREDGEIVADGLRFPEGPVLMPDGSVCFVEIDGGRVSRWSPGGGTSALADTGGGPNGIALGPDGALYVTQSGGRGVTPGIQRVGPDGDVRDVATAVDGLDLGAPNDLAFGPDGRLWFTDPNGRPDPDTYTGPGRLFVLDIERGTGELVLDVGPVFPNGIAFDADGVLHWTESLTRRVCRLEGGDRHVVAELADRRMPDGMCFGIDGRAYVAATYSHCVTILDGGEVVDELRCGDGMPTNCCFVGTDLIVTESRRGTLWRWPLGTAGLALR